MAEVVKDTGAAAGRRARSQLEERISSVGRDLSEGMTGVIDAIPGGPHGPQSLARALEVDKVLTSRLLKATRAMDPMAIVHHVPGPDPLRRFLRSAAGKGVSQDLVTVATEAVDEFEQLIRQEAGDRSSLDAIISAWLPEVRRDFELRRKQAAFRAMSQLKGSMVETNLATVLLHPSSDGTHIDIVWIIGLLGLTRLRPGVSVKMATRRMAQEDSPRAPVSLGGKLIRGVEDARLDEFCAAPPAELEVDRVGEVLHYTLAGRDFGPRSAVDIVLVEVNMSEMARYVPAELGRKGNVFAEISSPAKGLVFDVLVHKDVYPGEDPQLLIYDTAFDGVADINDPTRDVDRMDMIESVQLLGRGTAKWRNTRVASYVEMLREVYSRLGWDDSEFRGFRCAIDYPVYGSQVAMAFKPPPPPPED